MKGLYLHYYWKKHEGHWYCPKIALFEEGTDKKIAEETYGSPLTEREVDTLTVKELFWTDPKELTKLEGA